MYWWDGAVQTEKEWRVTFKTTAALADRLIEHIVRERSYDVPEVLVMPVIGGHRDYLEWMRSETRQARSAPE